MMTKKILILLILIAVIIIALPIEAFMQCPMCRMAAESNLQNGGTQARGLNNGILYMLAMPYLLIGVLAIIWYRNRKVELDV
jgi:heme/copper-type cytochrome/quinol oxidase subunit 2